MKPYNVKRVWIIRYEKALMFVPDEQSQWYKHNKVSAFSTGNAKQFPSFETAEKYRKENYYSSKWKSVSIQIRIPK